MSGMTEMHQMTIFEWLQPERTSYPDINDIDEAEAVRLVWDALGVKFIWNDFFALWIGKKGKLRMDLEYSHFDLDDNHDLFLGAGYECGTSGGASPTSGIEEAIAYVNKAMKE
jgi:hypothetical protein